MDESYQQGNVLLQIVFYISNNTKQDDNHTKREIEECNDHQHPGGTRYIEEYIQEGLFQYFDVPSYPSFSCVPLKFI